MIKKKAMMILMTGILSAAFINSAMAAAVTADTGSAAIDASAISDGSIVISGDGDGSGLVLTKTVKASEMGMLSQDSYDYPYLGLKAVLPEELKKQLDDSDVLMMSDEIWNDDLSGFKYAYIHWNKLTDEQKNEDVNLIGTGYEDWLKTIDRIGVLGVYSTDVIDELDTITGCTEHKELGESSDGRYKYYLSTNKDADSELIAELEKIEVTLTDMTAFDSTKSVFDVPAESAGTGSQSADADSQSVGTFETTDINGNSYTESIFSEYDLTLVNIFATWCTPCVGEMPELEQLYQDLKDQGVGIIGFAMDTVDISGQTDESAVATAQQLQEKTGVTYPLLMPDSTMLNGRLSDIQAVPETFFVDKNGNIVGDTIIGANDYETWKSMIEELLQEIKAE